MVDTVQTVSYLTGTEAPDSLPGGGYTLQFLRDFMVTAAAWGSMGTTAGTAAAAGGPSGTGSSIADGSCTWRYLAAVDYTTLANASSHRSGRRILSDFGKSVRVFGTARAGIPRWNRAREKMMA